MPFVSLLGPGGIGKTRLALEVARQMEQDFAHGAVFVSLASIRDAGHIVPSVAEALGIREDATRPIGDVVLSALRDRHMLLVLDNLEHLIEGVVGWVDEVLANCPRLTLLVTSRVALGFAGEHRFHVPPLPLPDRGAKSTVDVIAENASVSLFSQRARAIRSDFRLTAENARAVSEICLRLDGVPLAIELAAARINVLTPTALLDRLTHQLDVLVGGGRHLPSRHQTMSNAVAWSYDLLPEAEQRLFRRLSVFVGGFSLDAAEAMGGFEEDVDVPVLDLVASLVDHSLIRQIGGVRDETRFTMLEPIREFGLERLRAHGEESTARDAHAAWYLRVGADAERGVLDADQVMWLDRLEAEHDNMRSVFTWLFEQERVDDAACLAVDTAHFRSVRGHNREYRPYLARLLEHPLLAHPTSARGKGLLAYGRIALGMGDVDESYLAVQEALSIFRESGEHRLQAYALGTLGLASKARNDLTAATARFEESVALGRELESARVISVGLGNLGDIAWAQGRMDEATSLIEESLQVARASNDAFLVAHGVGTLGTYAFNRGDYDQAELLYQERMDLIIALDDKRDLPAAYISLAEIARIRGDLETASAHLENAREVAREIGDPEQVAFTLMAIGNLASLREEHAAAAKALRQGITVLRARGAQSSNVADGLDSFAAVAVRAGDMEAARFIGAVDATLSRIGIPRVEGLPQREHRERRSVVHSALGEFAFMTSYEAGWALTLDAAVNEALAYVPSGSPPQADSGSEDLPAAARTLTSRELEVLKLMADGLTNQQIADAFFISPRTAANHAANILGKLGLTSRTGVVAYAIRNGLA